MSYELFERKDMDYEIGDLAKSAVDDEKTNPGKLYCLTLQLISR